MDMDRMKLPRIDDAKLNDDAPAIRAEVLRRLEQIWAAVSPKITPPTAAGWDEEPPRLDPRFVDAGIRVLDRLMRLYRLDAPGVAAPEPLSTQDAGERVARELLELERRLWPAS